MDTNAADAEASSEGAPSASVGQHRLIGVGWPA